MDAQRRCSQQGQGWCEDVRIAETARGGEPSKLPVDVEHYAGDPRGFDRIGRPLAFDIRCDADVGEIDHDDLDVWIERPHSIENGGRITDQIGDKCPRRTTIVDVAIHLAQVVAADKKNQPLRSVPHLVLEIPELKGRVLIQCLQREQQ